MAPTEAARRALIPGYSRIADMRAPWREGSPNTVYMAGSEMVSDLFRSPARNGAVQALAPKPGDEVTVTSINVIDAQAIGAVIGGVGSFLYAKIVGKGMEAEAKSRNLPDMLLTDLRVLVPDHPPLLLHHYDRQGTQACRFWQPATHDESARYRAGLPGKMPTRPELEAQVNARRESLASRGTASTTKEAGASR